MRKKRNKKGSKVYCLVKRGSLSSSFIIWVDSSDLIVSFAVGFDAFGMLFCLVRYIRLAISINRSLSVLLRLCTSWLKIESCF